MGPLDSGVGLLMVDSLILLMATLELCRRCTMNRASGGRISGAIVVLVCWETRLQREVWKGFGEFGGALQFEVNGKRLKS